MKPARHLAIAAILAIATQSALAAAAFSTAELDVRGDATLRGTGVALFLVAPEGGTFSWDATAATVTIEREVHPWVETSRPDGASLWRNNFDPRRETVVFTGATLAGRGMEDLQALLARALAPLDMEAASRGAVRVDTVEDAQLDQHPADTDAPTGRAALGIREIVPGEHLRFAFEHGAFVLRGDLTLLLVGPDYDLAAAEGAFTGRTGERTTDDALLVRRGETERQRLTLTDAVLRVQAPGGGVLLADEATLTFSGTLRAADSAGEFPVAGLAGGDGTWSGEGALALSALPGRVGATAPDALDVTGTARLAQGPPVAALAAAALALLALAALVVLLARRRAARADPVALALLAMEGRRWEEALPHLDRALRAAPADVKLLLDRAVCLEQAGRLTEARDAYEQVLRVEPFHAESHYYYARTLARLRNTTAALAHLSRALALDARLGELARQDASFSSFRDHPQFAGLLR